MRNRPTTDRERQDAQADGRRLAGDEPRLLTDGGTPEDEETESTAGDDEPENDQADADQADADREDEPDEEAGDDTGGSGGQSNVQVTDAGGAEPGDPKWEEPDLDDLEDFELRADHSPVDPDLPDPEPEEDDLPEDYTGVPQSSGGGMVNTDDDGDAGGTGGASGAGGAEDTVSGDESDGAAGAGGASGAGDAAGAGPGAAGVGTGAGGNGDVGPNMGTNPDATEDDPTAGMPHDAQAPGATVVSQQGTEAYVAALDLCARLPEDVKLPEESPDLVPVAVEAELEQDIQQFAASEFGNQEPHVDRLDFVEDDDDIWLRIRIGVPADSFAELDPEQIRTFALEQLEGVF